MEGIPVFFHKQCFIPGVTLFVYKNTFIVSSARPMRVIGTAVLGAELRLARYIINHSVEKSYGSSAPEEELRQVAESLMLGQDVLGMMTTASINNTVLCRERLNGLAVATLCTADWGSPGLGDLAAGLVPEQHRPTNNFILLIDGNLNAADMVNAVITASEARTKALLWPAPSGAEKARGAGSIVVACTGRGEPISGTGKAASLEYLLGSTVHRAVSLGMKSYPPRTPGYSGKGRVIPINGAKP
jgi:iron complex transport system ATP-binding protein